jgi:1-deoxy-D-xylulose-5-phosphate synthase
MVNWKTPLKEIPVGKGRRVKNGTHAALLSIGHPGNFALEAAENLEKEGYSVAHYDMRFVKPLDEVLLHEVFSKFDKIITIEDGCIQGGMGSAVIEFMADNGYQAQVKRLGIPDQFIEHGEQRELYAECGFDVAAISNTVLSMVKLPAGNVHSA